MRVPTAITNHTLGADVAWRIVRLLCRSPLQTRAGAWPAGLKAILFLIVVAGPMPRAQKVGYAYLTACS